MQRLQHEYEVKEKFTRSVCRRVHELLKLREKYCRAYVTRPIGTSKYVVTIDIHGFVVDISTKESSCGLWQLGGIPCIHAVCVYQSPNKDPRDFVHHDFSKSTFLKIYKNFLSPIRGPMNWPKMNYSDILPPIRRHIDPSEARERAKKEKEIRESQASSSCNSLFKAKRKGGQMKCGKCGGLGHNTRGCAKASQTHTEE